jgi:fructosamine-3-kinase
MNIAGVDLAHARPVAGGDICQAYAGIAPDGSTVFAKSLPDAPAGLFEAEAAGLDRLRIDAGPPVPAVHAVGPDGLVLEWVEPGRPAPAAAGRFGASLAHLHGSGGERFGADTAGFVATIKIDNTPCDDWPTFFAERRLVPALTEAVRRGAIKAEDEGCVQQVIDELARLAGPPEPPARIHGDLWAGNVLWAADGEVWLVDAAAACDGHRETDLAMLALFGAPHLPEILAAYQAVAPLPDGWQSRVALHQLHPLLIHAVLFGSGYGARAGAAAREAFHALR